MVFFFDIFSYFFSIFETEPSYLCLHYPFDEEDQTEATKETKRKILQMADT